jgi:hypothetical protein
MSTILGTTELGPATAKRQVYSPLETYWNAFQEWRKRQRLRATGFGAKRLDGDFRPSFWIDLVALHAAGLLSPASALPEKPNPPQRLDRDGE